MQIKVTMEYLIEADSIEEAQEIFYEWNDYEFLEESQGATTKFEEYDHA